MAINTWVGTSTNDSCEAWTNAGYITLSDAIGPVIPSNKIADDLKKAMEKLAKAASPQQGGDLCGNTAARHQKEKHRMNLYPSQTRTTGGYRAQITLDEAVVWEGTTVHGKVLDENGKRQDDGSRAAYAEASDLITSVVTDLFATATAGSKAA